MGRFESTVEFYKNREPYPPLFFETVAQKLSLNKETRLLDIGTGPGLLAIGFAPFVGACTAVDREPAMLQVARETAAEAGANIDFVEANIEDLTFTPRSFDFVTVGRALHWFPLATLLPMLEEMVELGGAIAICGSSASDSPINEWVTKFKEVRKAWSDEPHELRHKIYQEEWFAASRFRKFDEIQVTHRHTISLSDVVRRALSFSVTSPALLADKRPQFESEVMSAVAPFAQAGMLEEELTARATLLR